MVLAQFVVVSCPDGGLVNFFVGFILNIGLLWLCLESELDLSSFLIILDFVITVFGCGNRNSEVLFELWNLRQDRP